MIAAAAIAAAACGRASRFDLERDGNRNVLLVTIDTLRAGALGSDGGPSRTPNIDALARQGVRFTFAHAHAVTTLPSHASMLTGLYPFQHGYRENSGYRLTPSTQTVATRLANAGFATAAFVGAFPLDARFGLTPGFATYDGRFDDTETGAAFVIPERPATVVVERAVAWIAAQRGRWFAWVHVYEPHAPYRPPPPFDREYASQPYYGEVAAVDAGLGPLFEAVGHSPRPTLVIVTGDHGEALGEHGEATHGLFAYESTLHVPLIIGEPRPAFALRDWRGAAAGRRDDGRRVDEPARHVDLLPTILDALDLPIPTDLPGHSLRTAADRQDGERRASYFEAMSGALEYGWAPLSGVLVGRQKFVQLPIPELYDLARDAAEQDNRAPHDAEATRTLASRLAQFSASLPAAPQPEAAEVAARLRSLGYVTPTGARPPSSATERDDPKRLVHLDRRMHEAAELEERGRLPEAIAVYRAILTERPEMIAASRHLAFDYWRVGDAAAATETLRRELADAARRSPTAAASLAGISVQLASYLVESGRASEAITIMEQAVALEPAFDALNALGLAYARAGRASEAQAAFDRALQIDPGSAMVYENVGAVALDRGQLSEARRAFEQALARDPQSAQAHNGLAMSAERSGNRRDAIEHWTRAVELQPSNYDALYDLGMTLARDGQPVAARRYLEQFVRSAPAAQYGKELRNARTLLNR